MQFLLGPVSINDVRMVTTLPLNHTHVEVQWVINVSMHAMAEKYFVTVIPLTEPEYIVTTHNTSIQLIVLYNQEYNISVVANNCVGNSTRFSTIFNISKFILDNIQLQDDHMQLNVVSQMLLPM